jgi:hypothetical protein
MKNSRDETGICAAALIAATAGLPGRFVGEPSPPSAFDADSRNDKLWNGELQKQVILSEGL